MQENILAVDLSTEQVLEVNLPEQDNVAQIDVYWQDEVTLDLDLSLMYIVSGQREIQDYVDNKSKPEIDDYIETYAKPIVSEVVEEIAAPVVGDYIENTVKPDIKEFADKEMANYAQIAGEQAVIATEKANLAEASALASSETLTSVNNKAIEFGAAVNNAKVDIQSATDASITNINNTVSAEIIPNLEGYVSSATNQASIAASKANEAQSSANASKTSETNAQSYSDQAKGYAESVNPERFLNKEMITNCITEIPQDIKLELNDGVLTLKAGSKVYVPNGAGVFNEVNITTDRVLTNNTLTGKFFIFATGTSLLADTMNIQSGSTFPSSATSGNKFYNTTENKFYRYSGTEWQPNGYSFPLAIVTLSSGSVTSIDQVFNGFGYIGSTVFALPGVKGLVPNGRNADGSLRNIEWTNNKVVIHTETEASGTRLLWAGQGEFTNTNSWMYDETINKVVGINNGVQVFNLCCGNTCTTQGKYDRIDIKQPFHAVDRNDSSWVSAQAMPSGKYINLSLGASSTTYTAPANGYFYLDKVVGATDIKFLSVINTTKNILYRVWATQSQTTNAYSVFCPVEKGDTVRVEYNFSGDTNYFRFYYCEGEN